MRVCTNAEFDNIAYLFYNENQSIFSTRIESKEVYFLCPKIETKGKIRPFVYPKIT